MRVSTFIYRLWFILILFYVYSKTNYAKPVFLAEIKARVGFVTHHDHTSSWSGKQIAHYASTPTATQ